MSLGGWCAEDSDNNPYLQVDLVHATAVTAVATQGLPGNENLALKYMLNYSCDGIHWFEYYQGKVQTLAAPKQGVIILMLANTALVVWQLGTFSATFSSSRTVFRKPRFICTRGIE